MNQHLVPDRTRSSENANGAAAGTRSIFRSAALERYVRNQERAVYPRLVSPRSFRLLWVFAGVLMTAGFLIAFWPILAPFLDGAP